MDGKKEIINDKILDIPEAEIMDFWEEGSEYVMYDTWDRIKGWFKKNNRISKLKKDLEIFWTSRKGF